VSANESKRHHYVPQFYLRRFACPDDANKVMVLERHSDVVVADRKSIDRIGYEDGLHDYDAGEGRASIESALNKVIETPFSKSATWLKIANGDCASLDETDRLPLYGFARHLQLRNLETLRFIEDQHSRFLAGELEEELTDEEREMYDCIATAPGTAHALFRAGAMETALPVDAGGINVIVCKAPIELRASTNPTVRISVPGQDSIFGEMFNSLRTWWITLDRHWGAFSIAGGPPGFSTGEVPSVIVRVANRQYLVQFLNDGARYMLADDGFLGEDLKWASFAFAQRTTRGFRYRAVATPP
jgi:hypothetical protein